MLEVENQSEADTGDPKNGLDDGYLGMKFDNVRLAIGETDYVTDKFGVKVDYEMAPDTMCQRVPDGGTDRSDVIFGDVKIGNSKLYFSTDLAEGDSGTVQDEDSVEVFLKSKFSGLKLGLGYQNYKKDSNSASVSSIGVSLKGKAGNTTIGVALSSSSSNDKTVT